MRPVLTIVRCAVAGVLLVALAGCGDDDGPAAPADRPTVVVTTNILGDVVRAVVGEEADVEVVMPVGSDPHDFEPSARQAESMEDADLLVVNGAGFEGGMVDVIEAATEGGTPTFAFADHVELLEFTGDHDHDHEGEDHAHEEKQHADEDEGHDHEEGPDDPHFFTDPTRVAAAVEALADELSELDGVDADAIREQADEYLAELEALDADIEDTLAAVPEERRVLVTNHEVFGYFAERYGFEVVGAVIPTGTTRAEPSAADLEELADVIRDEGVPAIFGETTDSTQLAEALADSVGGDVEVVELYTESLGEPGSGADTYIGLLRTDAELIAQALG